MVMPAYSLHANFIRMAVCLCFYIAWSGGRSFAQMDTGSKARSFKEDYPIKKDSNNIILYYLRRGACKFYTLDSICFPDMQQRVGIVMKEVAGNVPPAPQVPFLQLHGNIAYTFDYRSRLDTPFAASNLQQHNEQTYADATLKGKYPFRVVVNSRQSNTVFLRNYTDVSAEFKHEAFQQSVKDAMIADMVKKMRISDSTNKYEQLINSQKTKYVALRNWLADPARTQAIVEERERLYQQLVLLGEQKELDSLSAIINAKRRDSLLALMQQPGATERNMRAKDSLADSLHKTMEGTQRLADSLRVSQDSIIQEYAGKIRNARSIRELEDVEKEAGTHSLGKTDKTLLAVTHFGIGRGTVNYSDLTANNISLTGVNIEYNPSFYAAFAAGSVDYFFRDFVVQPLAMPRQNLVLGRIGWGDKDKRVFILTAYTGTKNSFGGHADSAISLTPPVNSMHIFGYSFEAKYKVDPNKEFSFEAAKSSSPYTAGGDRSKSFNNAFAFSDHNNEALSLKFDMRIPATRSAVDVFYKKAGANFQSYSIFNNGARQEGWGARWRQHLFKDQLSVSLQIRKNIFDDPLIVSTYSSSLLFKSVQLVYRKKKWPVFSAGYMPSTQLVRSSDGSLSENIYYALTASVFYNYTFLKLRMNSSLMYSRFYNKGTDSGFILYNARNIIYSHQVDLGKVHTTSDVQYTAQPGLLYWMFAQRVDVALGKYLTAGAGLKNDWLPGNGTTYWGGSLQCNILFRNVGGLRMQFSKDYLPNGVNGLVADNWGRINWFKVF